MSKGLETTTKRGPEIKNQIKEQMEMIAALDYFLRQMKPYICVLDGNLDNIIWHHMWLDVVWHCKNVKNSKNINQIFNSIWIKWDNLKKARDYLIWRNRLDNNPLILKTDSWSFSINSKKRPDGNIQLTLKDESKVIAFEQANQDHAEIVLNLIVENRIKLNQLIRSYKADKWNIWIQDDLLRMFNKFQKDWINDIRQWDYFGYQFEGLKKPSPKLPVMSWLEFKKRYQGIASKKIKPSETETDHFMNMIQFFSNAIPVFLFSPDWEEIFVFSWKHKWQYKNFDEFFHTIFGLDSKSKWASKIRLLKILKNRQRDLVPIKIWSQLFSLASMSDITEEWWFQATFTHISEDQEDFSKQLNGSVDDLLDNFLIDETLKSWKPSAEIQEVLDNFIEIYQKLIVDLEGMVGERYKKDFRLNSPANLDPKKEKVPAFTPKKPTITETRAMKDKLKRLIPPNINYSFKGRLTYIVGSIRSLAMEFHSLWERLDEVTKDETENKYHLNANKFLTTLETTCILFKRIVIEKRINFDIKDVERAFNNISKMLDLIISLYIRPSKDFSSMNLKRFNESLIILNQIKEIFNAPKDWDNLPWS